MTKLPRLLALLLTALLLLTACASDNTSDENDSPGAATTAAEAPSADSTFNDADVTFARAMIPHHQQAVEMSQLAQSRGDSTTELAAQIEAAQAPEIEQLSTWLREWGAGVPAESVDHAAMGHGGPSSAMSGMMTAADMTMLGNSSGANFDQMFLSMMIEHHEGAVEMANTQLANGKNPDATALAEQIISSQQAEIEQMRGMLGSS